MSFCGLLTSAEVGVVISNTGVQQSESVEDSLSNCG